MKIAQIFAYVKYIALMQSFYTIAEPTRKRSGGLEWEASGGLEWEASGGLEWEASGGLEWEASGG